MLDTGREKNFDLITGLVQNLLQVPICAVPLTDEDRQWFKSQQGLELRPNDRFGRLGGEEFGVLLTGSNLRQAKACAERLRRAFEKIAHPLYGPITASFEIAMLERGISRRRLAITGRSRPLFREEIWAEPHGPVRSRPPRTLARPAPRSTRPG
ncbi:diguanylate cyclase [Sphingomonas sp. KRR8]|uniref:diguanylate cyclase domain-containing protein n=1 Tax=Sphingomonas sp. KRR8 TaxID=2942996 RepID=UPI0020219B26|nr:diguanylate cyclase [Sphingomonas sp. KRR8]URD61601.1 diguanylate cyclase [Sphingomonas sp. KRR8]